MVLRRLTYFLEHQARRGARATLPFDEIRAIELYHVSTLDHLTIFLEQVLTLAPRLKIDLMTPRALEEIRGRYPGWDALVRGRDVQLNPPKNAREPADVALLLYTYGPAQDTPESAAVRRRFTFSRAARKFIIHGDGVMLPGGFFARLTRRLLRPLIARSGPIRDRRERRILGARLLDDPGYDPAHPPDPARLPPSPRRPVIDFPLRVEQDPVTGMIFKPDLIAGCVPADRYEEGYHDYLFYNERRDWERLTREYQDRRWRNMRKVGLRREDFGPAPAALDLGCGPGCLAARLAEEGFATLGTDVARATVETARRNYPRLRFEVADLETLARRPERFDLVAMSHVLEHISDDVAFLRGASALLRPGGRLYIEVPWFTLRALGSRPDWHRQWDHCREYTKLGLYLVVCAAGCEVLAHADSLEDEGREPYQFLLARPARGPSPLS